MTHQNIYRLYETTMRYMEILRKAGERVQKAAHKQDRTAFDEAWAKYKELLEQFGFKKVMRS